MAFACPGSKSSTSGSLKHSSRRRQRHETRADAGGGSVTSLCDADAALPGAWSKDNVILFTPRNNHSPLYRVSAAGGTPSAVTTIDGGAAIVHSFPSFLTDGRHFLFLSQSPNASGRSIEIGSLDSKDRRRVIEGVSISRGLARGLETRSEYKQMMNLEDTPRESDLDGRGNLSERALIEFVTWFLRVALDQVTFMSELFDLDNLANRLRTFVARDHRFKPEAASLLEQTLVRGEIERGEASRITGLPVRTAQRLLNDLVGEGLLAATTPKRAVSLRFPANSLDALFPRLYPLT